MHAPPMTARCDHLLRFEPLFRRYLWGGRRLATMLGKQLGEGDDYAESWEIVDHRDDQSVVVAGPLAGRTLNELVGEHRDELFGKPARAGSISARSVDRFPLLLKFLDCNQTLSVQVHPNDEQAAKLDPPDLGKTEAWVVLHAEPGSQIFAGLKPGVTRESLAAAIKAGRVADCLHAFEAKAGDCVFIPAGTVHALGAGLVIAEIQQASDTTFRLFDWNRVDASGKPRTLHVEQSLAVIDYAAGPVAPQTPRDVEPGVERLVECDKFVLDRREVASPITIGGDGRFHLLAVVEGAVEAADDPVGSPLARGMCALVPAAAGPIEFSPQGRAVLLDVYLPR
jgi:mannose-6-phosphate isomerase